MQSDITWHGKCDKIFSDVGASILLYVGDRPRLTCNQISKPTNP